VKEEPRSPVTNGSITLSDDELLRSICDQPSWVSSPDLRFENDSEHDEERGSVSDLYGSLLKGVDADLDSELTHPNVVLRRHNHVVHPATINVVSNRVINRLSNVISKGRADVRARLRPQPIPKEFQPSSSLATDADEHITVSNVYEEPCQNSPHESLNSPSLPESMSSNDAVESKAVFERGSAANASYRRLVVPTCPSMVTSNLVHVQSSKALIIVSGGAGYKCWNTKADLPAVDDSCLLLWKC